MKALGFALLLAGFGLGLFQQCSSVKTTASAIRTPPNLIVILADDMGYGDVGCYRAASAGPALIQTPNLNRMAAQGMRFTDFYTGSTVCAPSRCALMTGQHTGHTQIRGNGEKPLRQEDVVIPELLKKANYTTGMFGKWGLGMPDTEGAPHRKGWDAFFGHVNHEEAHFQQHPFLWQISDGATVKVEQPAGSYNNDAFTQQALAFLDRQTTKPFLLYLAFTLPHAELHTPDTYLNQYRDATGKSRFQPEKPWPAGRHYGEQPEPKAAYAAMVSQIDGYVGQVLAKLDQKGLANNTLVLFASDNGTHIEGGRTQDDVSYMQSSGPLRGVKRDLFDGGIRTPFIVRWPGHVKAGSTTAFVGAFYDLLPTFCELANIPPPARIDGLSFVPTLLGQKGQPTHPYLYWEFMERGFSRAVRSGSWKAVSLEPRRGQETFFLFDLSRDIGEQTNVAAQHPDVVATMRRYMAEAHVPSPLFQPNYGN
ncbi:sulfatase [Fibrella aestuarina BUZ 2]|uniref:Sulfatase n=1 Tax=Fibrella aestuarina BUZ 2 TaxID=1166018 RepID=I0KEV7_9BACT|nr:arylsulfatase [Fibrella aestuarina]CCH02660.1 sulfatase [Fibrella aestuarina BUZ 2]